MKSHLVFCLPVLVIACILISCSGIYAVYFLDQNVFPLNPVIDSQVISDLAWSYKADSKIVSSPFVAGSTVFFRTQKSIIAVDALSGAQLWRSSSKAPADIVALGPKVKTNIVVVPEENSAVAAFSAQSGQLIWRTVLVESSVLNMSVGDISSFAINDDSVFVALYSWLLMAVDIKSGDIVWQAKMPNRSSLEIQANSSYVFLGTNDGLMVYDPANGDLLWQWVFREGVRRIHLYNDELYILSPDAIKPLTVMDIPTRKPTLAVYNSNFSNGDLRELTRGENVILLGGDHLFALSSDSRTLLWKTDFTGPLETPLIHDSLVIVRNTDKTIFFFDLQSGKPLGKMEVRPNTALRNEPERSPALYDNFLIVPFGDRRAFAYNISP